ncbi:MAG: carboxylesterase family protein [Actinomycetota bacterium]
MAKRDAPEVTVEQGRLRGRWEGKGDQATAVFKGVPFAAPPVGDLRWRAPRPAESWDGVREARKDGPMAIQMAAMLDVFIHEVLTGQGWGPLRVGAVGTALKYAPKPKQSEDCLYLTVRSPDPSPGANLPVMVWIHGGDHQDGSGSDPYYQANALAGRDVVTVAINYRLGVLGYLAHPEMSAESDQGVAGNYGTLDQIAALEWVRDNISGFGGDPSNVTVFGESAGGESVMHMMTSPLARGLFHRAVPQSAANSGQMLHLDRPFQHLESAYDRAASFTAAVGVSGRDQLTWLRAMSPAQLYEVARADWLVGNQFPAIDGYVLPESPFSAFAGGRQAPVPMMIGSNSDEGTLLRPVLGAPMIDFAARPLPETGLQPEIAEAFGDDMARLVEIYPGLDERDLKAEIDFMGDHMFGARAYYYARHHQAAGNSTFLYFFSRVPNNPKQRAGAFHAAELPFVHGSSVPIFPMSADDKVLSGEMVGYWTDFAATGNPNGNGTSERVVFPAFEPDAPQWLRLDHSIEAQPVERRAQYEIFNSRTDRLVAAMTAGAS